MTNYQAAVMNGLNDDDDDDLKKPHFVLVPLMAQGHMIPMTDLALLLAKRGVLVTLITTPINASRIERNIDRAKKDSGLPIQIVPLRFPCAEVGLPDGCENIDLIPSPEQGFNFFKAIGEMEQPLEAYLREQQQQQPYPSCIVADACHPWSRKVACRLRVPWFAYYGICCFTLLATHNISHHRLYDTITDAKEPFMVPGLAHKIEVTTAQAPEFFPGDEWKEFREGMSAAISAADGVVVNTFDELEPWYVEEYQKAMGTKVWSLGPLSLCHKDFADMAPRGNKASIDKDRCLRWLDSMKPRSVVYVSFGSLTYVPPSQLTEIGLGLEASGHPFIWVIKEVEITLGAEVERWLSGFEERVKLARAAGLIIKGWAPQLMILSHPAVGGFVTHCGWNSSMESICAGIPTITWPFFADQFLNERFIVDVLRTGVSVGVKDPKEWGFPGDRVLSTRDDVEKAVRDLMDEGEEERRRERATKLAEKARRAMEAGGSSYVNMTRLIEYVSRRSINKEEELDRGGEGTLIN